MPTRWDVGEVPQHSDAAGAACVWDRHLLADLGDPTVVAEIVTVFDQQVASGLPRLRDAIERDDAASAHEIAHLLKGSAATVGAQRMAALCEQLCAATAGAQTDGASVLCRRLTDTWAVTREAIDSELGRR
jgi:HPt (histidine-containing phosphotransfer) domain-containing protein